MVAWAAYFAALLPAPTPTPQLVVNIVTMWMTEVKQFTAYPTLEELELLEEGLRCTFREPGMIFERKRDCLAPNIDCKVKNGLF